MFYILVGFGDAEYYPITPKLNRQHIPLYPGVRFSKLQLLYVLKMQLDHYSIDKTGNTTHKH